MTHSNLCDRCHDSYDEETFVVQVETEPPGARPVTLRICPTCMQSFDRWARRGEGRGFGRKRHRPRHTTYTKALDRGQDWQDRWLRLENVLPILLVTMIGGLAVAAFLLSSYLRRR